MTREQVALAIVLRVTRREGGIADVGDGKGVTRFGQTPDWLATYDLAPPETQDEAIDNYLRWLRRTGLIGLCDVDDALADGVIDYAAHAGVGGALRSLQTALKVRPDGAWGPVTEAALASTDRAALARKVIADRARMFGMLLGSNPSQNAKYARGWMNRLAEQIEGLTS